MRDRLLLLALLPLGLTGCDLLRIKAFVPCEDTGAVTDGGDDSGVGCPLYHQDADGDGYGDPSAAAREFCDGPEDGWVDDDTDCDDTDAAVSPGATEVCNDGVDDDCDSLADGKDDDLDLSTATAWYPDFDGDGYGDDAGEVLDCAAPVDHVATPGDCNDSDAAMHPGAPEICNDQDDDCDTLVDDDDVLDDPDVPRWWYDGDGDGWAAEGDTVNACVAPEGYVSIDYIGDCDDGDAGAAPDLDEVCDDDADNDCDGDIDEDCASAVFGTYSTAELPLVFVGSDSGDASAWSFSGRGDLDGDTVTDVVIGAYRMDDTPGDDVGGVYVLPGPWDSDDGELDLDDTAAATWLGTEPGGNAGVRVSIVGDVDDDGYDDILIGADTVQGTPGTYTGRAYLIHGPALGGGYLDEADTVIDGPDENAYLGRYLAPGGDLDDDGYDDVIVGAYGASDLGGALVQPGVLYIYRGPLGATESDSTAYWRIEGNTSAGQLSHAATGDDLTSDGIDDLAFAAAGISQVYLMPGPIPDSFGPEDGRQLAGEDAADQAGFSLAMPGDVDDDGHADLLIGAYENDRGGVDAGAAFLVRGPIDADMSLETAEVVVVGDATEDYAGLSVAGAGDLDDDGVPDIAVAAPWNDEGEDAAGLIGVFYGAPGLSGTLAMDAADLRFTGSSTNEFLGYGLDGLGDLNGDGLDDLGLGSWNTGGGRTGVYFGGWAPADE